MTSTSSLLRDNSKALYQPWREEAFRADEYVQALAPIERWMLRALLQAAFVCSQRPYLPDDDARLCVLAGCESRDQWDQHSANVRLLFTPIELDGHKLLSHKKLVEDWDRMSKVRLARVESGRKGGLAKSEATNHQHGDEEKENRKEAKQTEPNQPNRSEVREVSSLPIASNSLAIGKVGGLEGQSVPSGNDGPSGSACSPPSSLGLPSAKTATGSPRSSGGEQASPEGAERSRKVLLDWESEFQTKVQSSAADHDDRSIVFTVPLPDKVFRWVEQTATNVDSMEDAQDAVITWLEARSFNALDNPNIVWDKMADEIPPFVPQRVRQ